MLVSTYNDGTRYLENNIGDANYDGICYTGQAVTFDGITEIISVPIPVTGINLIYFDYTINEFIQVSVTQSTTEDITPAGTAGNLSVWNYTFTDADLEYINTNIEWITRDTVEDNNIAIYPLMGSNISNELCLAWYPMTENITASSSIYDIVSGSGTIILNNYSDERRTDAENLFTGIQLLAYDQDSLGKIVQYTEENSFTILDTDDIVDTQYTLLSNSDWVLEEVIDLVHYMYVYNSTTKKLKKYIEDVLVSDISYTVATDTLYIVDSVEDELLDQSGNYIVEYASIPEISYKLDHDNLDLTITNSTDRQYFRFFNLIPDIANLYVDYIDMYFIPIIDNNGSYIVDIDGTYITEE